MSTRKTLSRAGVVALAAGALAAPPALSAPVDPIGATGSAPGDAPAPPPRAPVAAPDDGNDWLVPALGGAGAAGALLIGAWGVARVRTRAARGAVAWQAKPISPKASGGAKRARSPGRRNQSPERRTAGAPGGLTPPPGAARRGR